MNKAQRIPGVTRSLLGLLFCFPVHQILLMQSTNKHKHLAKLRISGPSAFFNRAQLTRYFPIKDAKLSGATVELVHELYVG
ncbi:hypothetical protein ALON55S_04220 [Alishewanella longhuensis]